MNEMLSDKKKFDREWNLVSIFICLITYILMTLVLPKREKQGWRKLVLNESREACPTSSRLGHGEKDKVLEIERIQRQSGDRISLPIVLNAQGYQSSEQWA